MVKRRTLQPQSVWDVDALHAAFEEAGVKPHHELRLHHHLLQQPEAEWEEVPELPKAAVALLRARFLRTTSKLLGAQRSADGQTIKLLVELQDGLQVESVIMEYDNSARGGDTSAAAAPPGGGSGAAQQGGSAQDASTTSGGCLDAGDDGGSSDEETSSKASFHSADSGEEEGRQGQQHGGSARRRGGRRATLCVSSEVGCAMGCTFCATGTMGLTADLTAGEILEQLVHARRLVPIRNVVFMGMGEPLNNYEAVRSAVQLMTHPRAFGLRRSAVTVSTVGVVPRLASLAQDLPGVSLALSLHAPTQELRARLVPSARAYPLPRLLAAVQQYQEATKQRVFVEYVMLGPDVNCTPAHAHELGALLAGRDVVVNLIPWNPVLSPGMEFAAPIPGACAAFKSILQQHYGLPATVRQEKGQDISGACGQLVLEHGGRGGAGGCGASSGGGGGGGSRGCASGSLADLEDLLPTPSRAAAVGGR